MSTEMAPWADAPDLAEPECPYCGGYAQGIDGPPPPRRRRPRRFLRRLRRLVGIIIALGLLSGITFAGLWLITPSVGNAPSLARALAQTHRAPYPGPPVPSQFVVALVATEDHRFYSEPGVDPSAIVRVIVGRIAGRPNLGGATLYQQLAKMLYTDLLPVTSGAEHIILGMKLAFTWSRAEILQMYSDIAYFGHGHYGLDEASCGYFGVPPARLSLAQAALLAGIVSAPSADNPIGHLAVARARQARVLDLLVATGRLTPVQASRAYRQPLRLLHGRHARCGTGPRRFVRTQADRSRQ